tara:strand:+ start:190 stop:708 length:519 start_codon:yes stop_codon:yes gene_type:complete
MATNLQFIKSQSFTGVSSVDVTDIFSATYTSYMITTKNFEQTGSNEAWISLRLINSSSTTLTTSTYDIAQLQMMSSVAFGENRFTNSNRFQYSLSYSKGGQNAGQLYIHNPFESSSYTFAQRQSGYWYPAGSRIDGYKWIGVEKTATSITGINIYSESGYDFRGQISVYGVK